MQTKATNNLPTPVATRSPTLAGTGGGFVNTGPVWLRAGFRPFFLLAALHAVVFVLLWVGLLRGVVLFDGPLPATAWHAHEMLFGFVGAVLAGFLLTAAAVWTGRRTARGAGLAALVALWCAGRATSTWALVPTAGAGAINLAFLPLVAFAIGRPILLTRRWRNVPFVGFLLGLTACQLVYWGEAQGWWSGATPAAGWVAIDLIALTTALIGGRIIPMFTRNAVTGAAIRASGPVDLAALVSLAALALVHALQVEGPLLTVALVVTGGLQLIRVRGWGLGHALTRPFVGVLHVGYLALGIGYLVEASAAGHPGRHVVSMGSIGLLCLAMMARVGLGHTGRPLEPPRLYWVGVAALLAAVGARLVVFLVPRWSWPLLAAGSLWSIAFAVFLLTYLPILMRPRQDGRPG